MCFTGSNANTNKGKENSIMGMILDVGLLKLKRSIDYQCHLIRLKLIILPSLTLSHFHRPHSIDLAEGITESTVT